jgi:hypothetical protein
MVARVQVECLYANKDLVKKVQSLGYAQCRDAISVSAHVNPDVHVDDVKLRLNSALSERWQWRGYQRNRQAVVREARNMRMVLCLHFQVSGLLGMNLLGSHSPFVDLQ